LERGNAQGDVISPFLFIIGYQILLFKLELNLQIKVVLSRTGNRFDQGEVAHAEPQVMDPDPKAFAMADDCTLLVKLERRNLETILQVLRDFETLSGLGCNVEKTALMQVGNMEPIGQDIVNLGLNIETEVTLLGAKLKNTGCSYEGNVNVITEKVRKQVNFWKRFCLSLPGRVSVAKTFLYSQINYLGCFLPIQQDELNTLSKEIENFVRGSLKISKKKLFERIERGGVGIFDLAVFLEAQCCTWFK